MKNLFKIIGIIALIAVIGLGATSCGGGPGGPPPGGGNAPAELIGRWAQESSPGVIAFEFRATDYQADGAGSWWPIHAVTGTMIEVAHPSFGAAFTATVFESYSFDGDVLVAVNTGGGGAVNQWFAFTSTIRFVKMP